MSKPKRKINIESFALACMIMGFVVYVVFDLGLVNFRGLALGRMLSSKSAAELRDVETNKSSLHSMIVQVMDLKQKADLVEAKLSERVVNLKRTNEELDQIAEKLRVERSYLDAISNLVVELSKGRTEVGDGLRDDLGKPVSAYLPKFRDVAQAVVEAGVEAEKLKTVTWQSRSYLRLMNPFKFQSRGIYLNGAELQKAQDVSEAILDSEMNELRIVYNDSGDDGKNVKSRALVLRNYLEDLLGDDAKVRAVRVTQNLVPKSSIEIWLGER